MQFTSKSLMLGAAVALAGLHLAHAASNNKPCPGVQHVGDGGNDDYCCIGGSLHFSNCDGWPICKGPTSFDPATETVLSCATTVPLSAANYADLVSSASSKYLNAQGSATVPLTPVGAAAQAAPTAAAQPAKTGTTAKATTSAPSATTTTASAGAKSTQSSTNGGGRLEAAYGVVGVLIGAAALL